MSDSTFGPTIAKRRLSRLLAELRVANGFTANQVCDKLDWGRGKVGRFESNTWRRPEMSDIRDLLRLYEKSEDQRREVEELAVRARERAWWREFPDVFDNEFPGFEEDANRIGVFVPLMVPGLLATREYVEASMRPGGTSPEWRERALETRERRQQALERGNDAPQLVAVITEASLMFHWGSQGDRRDQVLHLIDMSERPNVELRMIRFADGPASGPPGPVNVLEFPGDEPGMVFVETEFDVIEVTEPAAAEAYRESFERIRASSTTPRVTKSHLEKIAKSLE